MGFYFNRKIAKNVLHHFKTNNGSDTGLTQVTPICLVFFYLTNKF